MKRISFMPSVFTLILAVLLFFPLYVKMGSAFNALAAHEEHGAKPAHGNESLSGEVPSDIPLEKIKTYIAPMNELNVFPCSDCHDKDWDTDRTRRDLDEPHSEIPGKFVNHDSENRWCLDCHSARKRDMFNLLDGTLVEFNEYYRLCEQCHKRVYREWKMGAHGKRTGNWNGEKQWMHCAQCHNPHDPPFQPIKPMPAPRTPENIRISEK